MFFYLFIIKDSKFKYIFAQIINVKIFLTLQEASHRIRQNLVIFLIVVGLPRVGVVGGV